MGELMGNKYWDEKDSFSLDGAIALANKIKRLWWEKGLVVTTRVEAVDALGGVKLGGVRQRPIHLYQVRSDMINGLPSR
jgi:hypothetical protein